MVKTSYVYYVITFTLHIQTLSYSSVHPATAEITNVKSIPEHTSKIRDGEYLENEQTKMTEAALEKNCQWNTTERTIDIRPVFNQD